jgi:hypothetical protein
MNIEQIHQYLSKDLSAESLKKFEMRLEEDHDLRMEVDFQKEMIEHLHISADIESAQEVIKEVHRSYKKSQPATKKIQSWLPAVLLTIIIIIALTLYVLGKTSSTIERSSDELYATYFEIPTASFLTKGDQELDIIVQLENAINAQDWHKALTSLEAMKSQGVNRSNEVLLYEALVNMGLEKYDTASSQLIALGKSAPVFSKDCDWYLALILIKSDEWSEAGSILSSLKNTAYDSRANELGEQIKLIK